MATNQQQVEQAIKEIRATKRKVNGGVNKNLVFMILKRYKAANWWNTYEDNEFSKAISNAAWDFIESDGK